MIIFPMLGKSERFKAAGYTQDKFMLPGKYLDTVFDDVLSAFSDYFESDQFAFVVRDDPAVIEFVGNSCDLLGIDNRIIFPIRGDTRGQADTINRFLLECGHDVFDIYIFNIDTVLTKFKKFGEDCDGYLEVFSAQGDHWSFVAPVNDGSSSVLLTAEKKRISNLCSNGLYYFQSKILFVDSYNKMIEKGNFVNNEAYIAPMYNEVIGDGFDVRYKTVDVGDIELCGTPAEYEIYMNGSC